MEMIEVKTAELSGPALDWAVAQCEGVETCWRYGRELARIHDFHGNRLIEEIRPIYSPSTTWKQGGPLIEKYLVSFCVEHEDVILAVLCDDYGMYISGWRQGENHLIAACRAIVAAKLGDTVRVPAALVGGEA